MKEITFLDAFQIIVVCSRKIYLKHIEKTPEDAAELVNIDERERKWGCSAEVCLISLLQPVHYTWGITPSCQPYPQNQSWRCPGTGEHPQWHWPAGIHGRGRITERADHPCRAPLQLGIIMWVNVTVCSKLQLCWLGLKAELLIQSCRPGWCWPRHRGCWGYTRVHSINKTQLPWGAWKVYRVLNCLSSSKERKKLFFCVFNKRSFLMLFQLNQSCLYS